MAIRDGGNINDDGIQYTHVDSTNVHSVGWRGGALFVRFRKSKTDGSVGRRYVYYQVPESLWNAMPLVHTGSE